MSLVTREQALEIANVAFGAAGNSFLAVKQGRTAATVGSYVWSVLSHTCFRENRDAITGEMILFRETERTQTALQFVEIPDERLLLAALQQMSSIRAAQKLRR
jgi:hypothetical protein